MARLDRHAHHSATATLDDIAPDDRAFGPVGTFDENVRLKHSDKLVRSVLVEHHDSVHALERFQNLDTLRFRRQRAIRALVGSNRSVGIDANDQHVTEIARLSQVSDVARMQEIEDAVRKDDGAAGGTLLVHKSNGLIARHASVFRRTFGENVQVCFGR
jgi:hypothetical protein